MKYKVYQLPVQGVPKGMWPLALCMTPLQEEYFLERDYEYNKEYSERYESWTPAKRSEIRFNFMG